MGNTTACGLQKKSDSSLSLNTGGIVGFFLFFLVSGFIAVLFLQPSSSILLADPILHGTFGALIGNYLWSRRFVKSKSAHQIEASN